MSFYSIKGTIIFIMMLILVISAFFSGNYQEVFRLIGLLVSGMILYQVGRWLLRLITGWDPHEGKFDKKEASLIMVSNIENNDDKDSSQEASINQSSDNSKLLLVIIFAILIVFVLPFFIFKR